MFLWPHVLEFDQEERVQQILNVIFVTTNAQCLATTVAAKKLPHNDVEPI